MSSSKILKRRSHVIVLNIETHTYLKFKISSPEKIIERSVECKCRSQLNGYRIFEIDCHEAFNIAKKNKRFCQYSESFGDALFLWKNSPKEIKDEYENVFKEYEKLISQNNINNNNI